MFEDFGRTQTWIETCFFGVHVHARVCFGHDASQKFKIIGGKIFPFFSVF